MRSEIEWYNFDGYLFTKFCNAVVLRLFGIEAKIKGALGPDGGIDAEFFGEFDEMPMGRWIHQYKFHNPKSYTDREANTKVRQDIIQSIGRLQDQDFSYFVLMTNVIANSKTINFVEELSKDYQFKIILWDGATIESLLLIHTDLIDEFFRKAISKREAQEIAIDLMGQVVDQSNNKHSNRKIRELFSLIFYNFLDRQEAHKHVFREVHRLKLSDNIWWLDETDFLFQWLRQTSEKLTLELKDTMVMLQDFSPLLANNCREYIKFESEKHHVMQSYLIVENRLGEQGEPSFAEKYRKIFASLTTGLASIVDYFAECLEKDADDLVQLCIELRNEALSFEFFEKLYRIYDIDFLVINDLMPLIEFEESTNWCQFLEKTNCFYIVDKMHGQEEIIMKGDDRIIKVADQIDFRTVIEQSFESYKRLNTEKRLQILNLYTVGSLDV